MLESNHLITNAHGLRKEQTPWEKKLWMYLRGGRLNGLKFKRQVPMGNYIVDFCCNEKKLIIELDGSHHLDAKHIDQKRDEYFKRNGYQILRFWNNEIDSNIDGVILAIQDAIG